MDKIPTFLLIALGVAANAAELPSRADGSKDASRLLRSSAATGSLPRFPEEPKRSAGISVDYPPGPKPPPIAAVVTELKEYERVEISLGKFGGLKEGRELDVYRGGTYLARIVVRSTTPNYAVGQIIPKTKRGMVRVGDDIRSKD